MRASSAVLLGLGSVSASCATVGPGSDLDVRYRASAAAGVRSLYHEHGADSVDSQMVELAVHSEGDEATAVFSLGQATARLEPSDGAPRVPVDLDEALFGGRCTFWRISDELHVYAGGGLAFVVGKTDALGGDKSERGQAAYLELGLQLWNRGHLDIGVNLRSLWGQTLDVGSIDVDPDYVEAALRVGWVF